jgi:cell filamentation protein
MPYSLDPTLADCYPETTILINKLDIRDEFELAEVESVMVAAHAAKWEETPSANSFDFEHYKALHHYLFSDLYDWAGITRTINISKKGTPFCPAKDIEAMATRIFTYLKMLNYFRGMGHNDFVDAIVDFYCSTNYLHPFREGNGRCQRLFLTQLAQVADYELNFSEINVDLLMLATIQSAHGITDPLREILNVAIKDIPVQNLYQEAPTTFLEDEDEWVP